MNRDDIIRMAREADLIDFRDADEDPHTTQMVEFFERFAALVAAAEREACIEIIETHRIPVGNSAAGEMACEWTYDALHEIRDAIRERSQQ